MYLHEEANVEEHHQLMCRQQELQGTVLLVGKRFS